MVSFLLRFVDGSSATVHCDGEWEVWALPGVVACIILGGG